MDKNGQKTIELRELNFEFQNGWRAGCNPPSVLGIYCVVFGLFLLYFSSFWH